jgi:hypothetical protein
LLAVRESTKDEINHRAYALYLMRGCEQGRDVEDWFRAEQELSDESGGRPRPKSSHRLAELRYPWPTGI